MRWRLFALLGLPAAACTPAIQPDVAEDAPIVDLTVADSAVAVEAPEPPTEVDKTDEEVFAHCEPDHYRDWMCGKSRPDATADAPKKKNPYATCRATSVGTDRRMSTDNSRPQSELPLDASLTEKYRARQETRFRNKRPEELCCFSKCVRPDIQARPSPMPLGYRTQTRCITEMNSTSKPSKENARCPAAIAFEVDPDVQHTAGYDTAMTRSMNQRYASESSLLVGMRVCCYRSARKAPPPGTRPQIMRGRALRDGGDIRVADLISSSEWLDTHHEETPDVSVANEWCEAAATEHASVAAFARLALQLLALDAPAALIADTHRAALDEIRHARMSFGLASKFSGDAVGPAALTMPRLEQPNLETLVRETFIDGCIGETVAALAAYHEADLSDDAAIVFVQRRIADDERRHAELGWRIVAWGLQRDPQLVRVLEEQLALLDGGAEAMQQVVIPATKALIDAAGQTSC
jgi:hypothetical protein